MEGKISAKMICDSIDPRGNRLRTLEIIMPRYILAEFNTHRMLSRNSASSRAIPFKKMVKEVEEKPFIPYAFQIDHKGMQGNKYNTDERIIKRATDKWLLARNQQVTIAEQLNESDGEFNITKQVCNRLLEPFMYHKVLVSGTEWDNFFNLRCPSYTFHNDNEEFISKSRKDAIKYFGKDEEVEYKLKKVKLENLSLLQWLGVNQGQADIHMMFLAEAIWDATTESTPKELKEGEWHVPYGDQMELSSILRLHIEKGLLPRYENIDDYSKEEIESTMDTVRKISIARCARLSYQTLGDNPVIDYEVDLKLYDMLAQSMHFSPFEHVARVMTTQEYYEFTKGKIKILDMKGSSIDEVIRVIDSKDVGWCYNYKGFIQERYLLEESWKG